MRWRPDRIGTELKKGTLTRAEMVTALEALQETRETNPVAELPKTDKAIRDLTAAIKGSHEGTDRGTRSRAKPSVNQGGAPGAFRPITQAIDAQRGELGNIKNAMATFNSKADAQKAELGNIKNTTADGDLHSRRRRWSLRPRSTWRATWPPRSSRPVR